MISLPPPSYEQTIEAVAACGVPRANIRIGYENELQSDVVAITDLGGADEERLRCVSRAIHPFYVVEIGNAAQRNAYHAFAERDVGREAKVEAVEWLGSAGMLDRVPRYDPAQGIETFARAVEAACGLSPGSALDTFDASMLTVRRAFFEQIPTDGNAEKLTCLSRMIAASNAGEHGVVLGVLGNEATSGDER